MSYADAAVGFVVAPLTFWCGIFYLPSWCGLDAAVSIRRRTTGRRHKPERGQGRRRRAKQSLDRISESLWPDTVRR